MGRAVWGEVVPGPGGALGGLGESGWGHGAGAARPIPADSSFRGRIQPGVPVGGKAAGAGAELQLTHLPALGGLGGQG